jgi:hypothetical protein
VSFSDSLAFHHRREAVIFPGHHSQLERMMTESILLPGINGSSPLHWQSLWEAANPQMRRFSPSDWDAPILSDWSLALDRAVAATRSPPVLVAHSLACLLVAHWLKTSPLPVAGAFLVAVPDPTGVKFPREAASFAAPPEDRFRCPSLILASSDDPYGSLEHAHRRAAQWGSSSIEIGPLGHVNDRSGLGDWPTGAALLAAFCSGLPTP